MIIKVWHVEKCADGANSRYIPIFSLFSQPHPILLNFSSFSFFPSNPHLPSFLALPSLFSILHSLPTHHLHHHHTVSPSNHPPPLTPFIRPRINFAPRDFQLRKIEMKKKRKKKRKFPPFYSFLYTTNQFFTFSSFSFIFPLTFSLSLSLLSLSPCLSSNIKPPVFFRVRVRFRFSFFVFRFSLFVFARFSVSLTSILTSTLTWTATLTSRSTLTSISWTQSF